jgi:hypothetical protein
MKSSLTKTSVCLLFTHQNPTTGEDLAVCRPCGFLLLLFLLFFFIFFFKISGMFLLLVLALCVLRG